jgi:hypothetical protein
MTLDLTTLLQVHHNKNLYLWVSIENFGLYMLNLRLLKLIHEIKSQEKPIMFFIILLVNMIS